MVNSVFAMHTTLIYKVLFPLIMKTRSTLIPLPTKISNTLKINLWFFLILLGCLLWVSAAAAEISEKTLPDAFTDVISKLSSSGDRSTGTAGNQEAALYIKEKFEQLGYENVGSYRFSTPVMRHVQSTLTLSIRNNPIELRPISGNAVTPQTVGPPGISAPLIYAGRGELRDLNGKQIAKSLL